MPQAQPLAQISAQTQAQVDDHDEDHYQQLNSQNWGGREYSALGTNELDPSNDLAHLQVAENVDSQYG